METATISVRMSLKVSMEGFGERLMTDTVVDEISESQERGKYLPSHRNVHESKQNN